MNSYREWAESFTIFATYSADDELDGAVTVDHDEMWAGPDPEIMKASDRTRLIELGWREDTDSICWQTFV